MPTKSFELSQMASTLNVGADETDVEYGHSGIFTGDLTVEGDFNVIGDTFTLSATELAVADNLIFLNASKTATITSASGTGSVQTYVANQSYQTGDTVSITSMNPSGYNVTDGIITGATATTFTVSGSEQGAYVSGGIANAKTNANPDLGLVGQYNDGAVKHAGIFRDATDGEFKFFDSYTPDPGSSINTSAGSFSLAKVTGGAAEFDSLIVDTSTLVVDATNNRVGVNVDVPLAGLHVKNTVAGDSGALHGILVENANATTGEAAVVYKTTPMGINYWFTGINQDTDFAISYGSSFSDLNCKVGITSSGNVGIGTTNPTAKLDVRGDIGINAQVLISHTADATNSTSQTPIKTFSASSWKSAEILVQVRETSSGDTQLSKLLVCHDGTTAVATEYGVANTGGILTSFDVDISGGNVRLLATTASVNATTYDVYITQLV
tara:strand:- start:228 stop:1544 length:1317 start_codon:yes stop_codon:yes gene_type:complete